MNRESEARGAHVYREGLHGAAAIAGVPHFKSSVAKIRRDSADRDFSGVVGGDVGVVDQHRCPRDAGDVQLERGGVGAVAVIDRDVQVLGAAFAVPSAGVHRPVLKDAGVGDEEAAHGRRVETGSRATACDTASRDTGRT